jgi:hypothetical protein
MRHAYGYANGDSNSYAYTDGYANGDSDTYTDSNTYSDTYTDAHTYGHSHGNGHANTDGNSHGYGNTDGNSHSAAETKPDTEAASDTAASPVALVENLKAGTRERKLASSPPAVAGDYSGSPVACEVAPVSCLPTKHLPPVAAATYGEAGAE